MMNPTLMMEFVEFERGNFEGITSVEKAKEILKQVQEEYSDIIPSKVFADVTNHILDKSNDLELVSYQMSYLYHWVERAKSFKIGFDALD